MLDWELATLGDPNADFVYHLMAWRMPIEKGGGTGTLVGLDLARLGIPTLEDYAASYARRMGLSEIPHFETLLAYNFFRLAAILQGIVGASATDGLERERRRNGRGGAPARGGGVGLGREGGAR